MDKTDQKPSRRLLETRADFQEGVDAIFAATSRELCLFDEALTDFNLNSPARCAALERFLLLGKKQILRIAVHDISNLGTRSPRLLTLLRRFSHGIEIRQTDEQIRSVRDTIAIADGRHLLRRGDHRQPRGVLLLNDPENVQPYSLRYEEIWAASTHALSPTTLGL